VSRNFINKENNIKKKGAEAPSPGAFKVRLDGALRNLTF